MKTKPQEKQPGQKLQPERIWSLRELEEQGYGHPATLKRAAMRGDLKIIKLSARRQGVRDGDVRQYLDKLKIVEKSADRPAA